jgi:hypothetical protein
MSVHVQVETEAPPDAEIATLIAKAVDLRIQFRRYEVTERRGWSSRSLGKFRPGGERIVRLIAGIAEGVPLEIPGASTEAMRLSLERATRLQPLRAEIDPLAQAVRDAVFWAESDCWTILTAYYSALKKMSRVSPELRRSLKDAIEFFAKPKRVKKDSNAPTPVELSVKF